MSIEGGLTQGHTKGIISEVLLDAAQPLAVNPALKSGSCLIRCREDG